MRILILGAGKMGSFFLDLLSFEHEVAVCEINPERMRFTYNCLRLTTMEEIRGFNPELVINAVTVNSTLQAFKEVIPHLSGHCVISDVASVKTGLKEYYGQCGHPYVSSHPMFGPTFANLHQLIHENAIIINEGDYMGRVFFRDVYQKLGLNIYEYTFEEHDKTVACSLSIPFASSFVFASLADKKNAPGTTFNRLSQISKEVLGEDDHLLQEVLFNPYTHRRIADMRNELAELLDIIDHRDQNRMKSYLKRIRGHVK